MDGLRISVHPVEARMSVASESEHLTNTDLDVEMRTGGGGRSRGREDRRHVGSYHIGAPNLTTAVSSP